MQLRDPKISEFLSQFTQEKRDLLTTFNLEVRPYYIHGCIPQVEGYHYINGDKFVKVEDYGKKLPAPKKLSVTVTDFMTIDESLKLVASNP